MNTTTSFSRPDRPFLPDDLSQPDRVLIRAATCEFIAHAGGGGPGATATDIARRAWPRDQATAMAIHERGAVDPLATSATALSAQMIVSGFIASLRPVSAAGRLIDQATQISLDNLSAVVLPGV